MTDKTQRPMDRTDLDHLEGLLSAATPGPWYVRMLDDEGCMCAVALSTAPPSPADEKISMRWGNWPTEQILGATLIQSPPYANHTVGRWDEDAALVAALRNAGPELLRLARLGLEAEGR